MPLKKSVKKLEDICLQLIPAHLENIFNSLLLNVKSLYKKKEPKRVINFRIEEFIEDGKDRLFCSLPSHFHHILVRDLISTISKLVSERKLKNPFHEREVIAKQSCNERQLTWLMDESLQKLVSIIANHVVKTLDISDLMVSPCIMKSLSANFCQMENLQTLNYGKIDCTVHNIFETCDMSGMELQFLDRLTVLQLSNVNLETIKSISTFNTELTSLTLLNTVIDDEGIDCINNLKKLRSIHLESTPPITPYGYAELLRNLPELRDLGRCDAFGEVLTTLYSKWSLYHRSVGSIPRMLKLESVDCQGPITGQELYFLQVYCPNLRKFGFSFNGKRRRNAPDDNLLALTDMKNIHELSVSNADFYSQSLFSILQTGSNLIKLQLVNLDEINLNSIILIGRGCVNLTSITIACCHYTPDNSDFEKLVELCTEQQVNNSSAPFKNVESVNFVPTTSVQFSMIKYIVYFSRSIKQLKINMLHQAVDDGFVSSLVTWNPMKHLHKIELINSAYLTIMAANTLIQKCVVLNSLGLVRTWGKVEKHEISAIKSEIRRRNLDLEFN